MAGTNQKASRASSWRTDPSYEEPRRETLDAEQRTQVDAIRAALAAAQPARKASPRQLVYEHLAPDIRNAATRGLTYSEIKKILAQYQLEINADTLRIYTAKAPRKPAPLPKSSLSGDMRELRPEPGTADTASPKSAHDPPASHGFNTESNAGGGPVVSKRVR